MTREEFHKLQFGEVVKHKRTGKQFIIEDRINSNVFSMISKTYLWMKDYINENTCEDYEKENWNG